MRGLSTIIVLLFFLFANLVNAQKHYIFQYQRDWAEPLFEGNARDFYATPGNLEFNLVPGYRFGKNKSLAEMGWEVEVSLTRKLGLETGFYSTGLQFGNEQPNANSAFMKLDLQYILNGNDKQIWATGFQLRPPAWSPSDDREALAWLTEPYLLLAYEIKDGINGQFRSGVESAWANGSIVWNAKFQGSLFCQDDLFTAGLESGLLLGTEQKACFFAPQFGINLEPVYVAVGANFPFAFPGASKPPHYLSARVIYDWEAGEW
jgi:hypothetical protein